MPSPADTPHATQTNPYVFVVGCPRSGTTLLQRMLDNHPLLAVANDSHFIPRAVENLPLGVDPPLTDDLLAWVRGYHRFHRLGLHADAVERVAAASTSYTEFVGGLYTEYAHLRGKELAGEKTPDYVRCLPRLHALFPSVRSIHIIRDGREVALSALEWAHDGKGPSKLALWEDDPVAVCALWWRWQVSTGRRDGDALGPGSYRETRYEDLVARPEQTVRALAEFLDLPHSVEMANFYVGKTVHRPGLSAKKAWLPPTPGLRDWRSGLPPCDVGLFEALAGDLLSDLGYERNVSTFSPEVRRRADRARVWWDSRPSRRHAAQTATAR